MPQIGLTIIKLFKGIYHSYFFIEPIFTMSFQKSMQIFHCAYEAAGAWRTFLLLAHKENRDDAL